MKQVVVITGLGQGMGRETAKLLAKSGDEIAGFDVDGESVGTLEEELRRAGRDPLLMKIDVTDRKGILKFRDETLKKYGRADV
ncbi:MAG TPA: SDR family NAD(P)-dependent oxidoreductase, partial [bacterium]|nr:SDR family NAD(P)-dependent oxidoreductase [bacterium]